MKMKYCIVTAFLMALFGDKSEILVNMKTCVEAFHLSLGLHVSQQQ